MVGTLAAKSSPSFVKLFFLFVPVLLSCMVASADVASVRREVTRVDARKLAMKSYDSSNLSSEGAKISIGRDGRGAPRKIVARIYGESGQKQDTIYLQNGLPLFMLSVVNHYKAPLSAASKAVTISLIETRVYFEKGRLIQKREGKKIVTLSASQKRTLERQTKATIRTYLAQAKK